MVKKIVGTGVLLVLALALQAGVKMYTLKSPDGKVKLEVTAGQGIAYSLFYDGRLLLKPSRIALHTDLPEADHWENIRITGTKQEAICISNVYITGSITTRYFILMWAKAHCTGKHRADCRGTPYHRMPTMMHRCRLLWRKPQNI